MRTTRPPTMPPPTLFAACAALLLAGCYGPIFGEPEQGSGPAWYHPDGASDDSGDPDDPSDTTDDTTDEGTDDGVGDLGGDPDYDLRGFVHDPLGLPLSGVDVWVDGDLAATTDGAGRFGLPSLQDGEQVVMGFSRDGFAVSWSSFVFVEGGHNFVSQTLAPVDVVAEFDTSEGAELEVDGSHWFQVPPDSIVDLDGNPYEGLVTLSLTVWDRKTPLDEGGEFLASPGSGQGVDFAGDDQLLYTYGMFGLSVRSESDEALQPGPGFVVQVEVPDDSNVQPGDQVPFWSYDEQIGTWIEEDSGQIVELEGGQQVWEFEPTDGLPIRQTTTALVPQMQQSSCNPDQIQVMVQQVVSGTATGTVTDQTGEPVVNAQVRLISQDQTYMISARTGQDGVYTATVPPQVAQPVGPNGRPLFVEVDYEAAGQPMLWRGDAVPPPGASGTIDLGVADLGTMTCLRGTVRDGAGAPAAGVAVATSAGGHGSTDASGSFCMQVPKWQPASVYALPPIDSVRGYQPARTRPRATSGGGCDSSCPNVVDLLAVPATSCVFGQVSVGDLPGDGLRVEAFDNRFPTAPVFSTVVQDGEFELSIPAGIEVTVRVGAGDLGAANACAQQSVEALPAGDACAVLAPMNCGE